MKRALLIVFAFALFLGITLRNVSAQKPGSLTPIYLKVIIEPTDSLGTPCQIRSDTGAIYVHGQEGIEASFDVEGDLIIDFQTRKTPQRGVTFDYSTPYIGPDNEPPTTPHTPVTGTYPNANLTTIPKVRDGSYIPLQHLPVGAFECVQLSWFYTLNDAKKTEWRHNFHRNSSSPFNVSQTAYGVVTRIDNDTWEVEPKAAACQDAASTPAVARSIDTPTKPAYQFNNNGLYDMPFKVTLQRK